MLLLSTQVRRVQTRPKSSGFFKTEKKILSTPSFGGEVKPSVPCRRFAAYKRSLNGIWKSTFRQNYQPTFSSTVPPFAARISCVVWTWRCLAAEIGMSKSWGGGSGLHNKPAVHLGHMLRALLRNRNRNTIMMPVKFALLQAHTSRLLSTCHIAYAHSIFRTPNTN